MNLSPENYEEYAQPRLKDLLEYATQDLQPGPGYELTLEGVQANTQTHKALEDFFQVGLSKEAGALMELGYNELTEQIILKSLIFPIAGIEGTARLLRTDTIGYIPVVEIRGQPFKTKASYMSHKDGGKVLRGFGVDNIPSYDPTAYRQWRGDVLSQTKGWHLVEKLDIPEAILDGAAQSTTLRSEEVIRETDDRSIELIRKKSLIRSIVVFDDEAGTTQHTNHILEFTSDKEDSPVLLFKESYLRSPDPFIINGVGSDAISQATMVRSHFDRNTFADFSNLLAEIIHTRRGRT